MKILLTTLLSGIVLSSSFATVAFSQTNDTGRALVSSNVLKLSANTERSGSPGSTTTAKEFIVPYGGVVRVRWQLKSDGATNLPVTAEVTSSIGSCSSSNTTATYQRGGCDLRVVAGDRISVVGRGTFQISPTPGQSTAFIRNVRIFYNVIDATGTGVTLVD